MLSSSMFTEGLINLGQAAIIKSSAIFNSLIQGVRSGLKQSILLLPFLHALHVICVLLSQDVIHMLVNTLRAERNQNSQQSVHLLVLLGDLRKIKKKRGVLAYLKVSRYNLLLPNHVDMTWCEVDEF